MGGRRTSRGRSRSTFGRRRASGRHTVSLTETGGEVAVLYGLVGLPGADGASNFKNPSGAPARFVNVLSNAKDVFVSKDPYWAPTRGAILGGTGLIVAGKAAKALLGAGPHIKLGRRLTLRLWE